MATPAQETLEFLARLGQRASRMDAARASRLAQLREEIASAGQAQRGLYGRVLSADGVAYPQYLDQFDDVAERMARLERTQARMTDDRPYLETVRRAYRAPGEPDMSLDSPLFGDMFQADRAFDQLRRGRTSNLRNSGGDLARIASQSIRDAEAAAAAGRSAMDRVGGPEGAVMLGVLGGTAAAAPAGMAINSALEARRMAEAFAAEQAALKEQYLNDIDGFDPAAADVVSPEFDQQLFDDLASYRGGIRPTTARAVEAHTRAQGLPTFPGTVISDADHAAGEQFAMQEQFLNDIDGFDAVGTPITAGADPQVFFTDDPNEQADYASMARGLRSSMDADAAAVGYALPAPGDESVFGLDHIDDPSVARDFHTMQPKTFEQAIFGPGVTLGPAAPPRRAPAAPSRRTVTPYSPKTTGVWY